jgi:hypothetical protein
MNDTNGKAPSAQASSVSPLQVSAIDPSLEIWLDAAEMAKKRRLSQRTLRQERQEGRGPPYSMDGKKAKYGMRAYDRYLKAREVNNDGLR